jgi:hypothetical protein
MKTLLKALGYSALTLTLISGGVMADQAKKTIKKNY